MGELGHMSGMRRGVRDDIGREADVNKEEREVIYRQITVFKRALEGMGDEKSFVVLMDYLNMMKKYTDRDAEFYKTIRKGRR